MRRPPDVRGCNPSQPRCILPDEVGPVDGDQDGAAEEGEDEEDVAAHSREAHEDGGVHADQVDDVSLRGGPEREDPRQDPFPQWWGRMFLVGMLQLGGVYDAIVRPEKREAYCDGGSDAQRGSQGSKHGVLLELGPGGSRSVKAHV